jgi:predicted nuclease of predicted toxin-antitoxin system
VRFLVDLLGRAVVDYVHQASYNTIFVGDVDPRMSGADILLWAVREQRIVVTMDADVNQRRRRQLKADWARDGDWIITQ